MLAQEQLTTPGPWGMRPPPQAMAAVFPLFIACRVYVMRRYVVGVDGLASRLAQQLQGVGDVGVHGRVGDPAAVDDRVLDQLVLVQGPLQGSSQHLWPVA